MSKDTHTKLLNQMAYGSISRGQIPGDIEDYNVVLVKQNYKNSPSTIKLKFYSKIDNKLDDFQIRIDQIRQPANPLILIKYQEAEGKVKAKATAKIKNKMILSVQKIQKQQQQVVLEDEDSGDSDIPKGKALKQHLKSMFSQFES